jgi:hypothetical protein
MKKIILASLLLFSTAACYGITIENTAVAATPVPSPTFIIIMATAVPSPVTQQAQPQSLTIQAAAASPASLTFTAAAGVTTTSGSGLTAAAGVTTTAGSGLINAASITSTAASAVTGTASEVTPSAKTSQPKQVFYIWVPYAPELAASLMYNNNSGAAVSGSAQGVSGTAQGVSGTAQGVSGTAQGVSGTAQGVSGTAQGVSGTAQGITGTAQGVSTTAYGTGGSDELPTGLTITAADGGTILYAFNTYIADRVKIYWQPKQPGDYTYNIYRATDDKFEKINPNKVTETVYADSKILSLTSYTYKIESVDAAGKSYSSLTFTVKTPAIVPPQPPGDFKAFQDIVSVSLRWSAAPQGSFPVSGYNIYRGKLSDKLDFCKFIPASKLLYTDENVEAAIKYYYKITAVDTRGLESKAATAPGVMPFPPPRTNICLMPTAYRNNIFDNTGFNVDCGFAYYIGTVYGEHNTDSLGQGTDTFKKNGIWLLSIDAKYTYFSGLEGWWPALGAGLMYSLLLQDSIGGSTTNPQLGTGATFGTKDSVLGLQGLYLTATKKVVWDFTADAGYVFGFKMYNGDQGEGVGGYIPYLVSSILGSSDPVGSGSADSNTNYDSKDVYYLGFSREIFSKAYIKVELMVPVEMNVKAYMPDTYIINTHMDKLFNFDVAYLHYSGGFAWIGYYNLRFSIFPSPYK